MFLQLNSHLSLKLTRSLMVLPALLPFQIQFHPLAFLGCAFPSDLLWPKYAVHRSKISSQRIINILKFFQNVAVALHIRKSIDSLQLELGNTKSQIYGELEALKVFMDFVYGNFTVVTRFICLKYLNENHGKMDKLVVSSMERINLVLERIQEKGHRTED